MKWCQCLFKKDVIKLIIKILGIKYYIFIIYYEFSKCNYSKL